MTAAAAQSNQSALSCCVALDGFRIDNISFLITAIPLVLLIVGEGAQGGDDGLQLLLLARQQRRQR